MALISFISLRRLGYFWEKVKEYIQNAIQPSGDEKEIVHVLSYGGTMPSNPEDGDRWINPENKLIYVYSESDGWGTDEPSKDVIYITNDTSMIYLWNGTEFVLSSGVVDDIIIYNPNAEDQELDNIETSGLYKVRWVEFGGVDEYYTMTVTSWRGLKRVKISGAIVVVWHSVTTQILYNHDGYKIRYKEKTGDVEGDWSNWEYHTYMTIEEQKPAIDAAIQEAKDWAVVGWVL